jgi:hypothetical protein
MSTNFCDECDALLHAYYDSLMSHAARIRAEENPTSASNTRAALEKARLDYERHVVEHGC